MRRSAGLVLAVLATGLLAACSDDPTTVEAGDGGGGEGTTTTTAPGSTTTPPPAAAGLVLQVTTGGGFVPVELAFANLPRFTLYADGRVVALGPTTLEYPGAALPNVLTGTVSADDVRAAVAAARAAGVAGPPPDLGQPPVADAPTTSIVLVDGGETHRVDAYALDMELDAGAGLSPAQVEARRRLSRFVEEVTALDAAATEPFRAAAVSVLARPYDAVDRGGLPGEPAPGEADWPLGDLGDLVAGGRDHPGGRCLGFTGGDAERVLAAAGQARSNTRWRSGGAAWALTFRPELAGVEPCTDR